MKNVIFLLDFYIVYVGLLCSVAKQTIMNFLYIYFTLFLPYPHAFEVVVLFLISLVVLWCICACQRVVSTPPSVRAGPST